jgi:dTDP-4-amino-4,6-dideoxygalactose transaminase
MWARKRIDIGFGELISAIGSCLFTKAAPHSKEKIANYFSAAKDPLVCLSVRSGFDLFLKTAIELYDWPHGSEIIFSGLTIPDMPRIARENGLKEVGSVVDWKTLEPSIADIESKISPKTKAIVVAHLMGSKMDLAPIANLAVRYDLLLIEDCAQSFTGVDDISSDADISMLSFGSIKTNTALGGAVIAVRDQRLREKMSQAHQFWPIQSRWQYLKKVLKYIGVKTISTWPIASLIRVVLRSCSLNHDRLAAGMARGFAGPNFFQRIRQRPCPSLTLVLAQRLERFDGRSILLRRKRGELLMETISELKFDLMPLGVHSLRPTHWVFAILVSNPQELLRTLWDQGFDATTHSSLVPIEKSGEATFEFMQHIVFLPVDLPMPDRELVRMGRLVSKNGHSCLDLESTSQNKLTTQRPVHLKFRSLNLDHQEIQ